MKTKLPHKLLIGMVVATSAFPIMATAPDAVQEIIGFESKTTQNKIMSTATDRNNVYLYVKAEGNKIYDVECTIGGVEKEHPDCYNKFVNKKNKRWCSYV